MSMIGRASRRRARLPAADAPPRPDDAPSTAPIPQAHRLCVTPARSRSAGVPRLAFHRTRALSTLVDVYRSVRARAAPAQAPLLAFGTAAATARRQGPRA